MIVAEVNSMVLVVNRKVEDGLVGATQRTRDRAA